MKIFRECAFFRWFFNWKPGPTSVPDMGANVNSSNRQLIPIPRNGGVSDKGFWRALLHRFVIGLKIIIPVAVTLFVLFWVLGKIDNILQPIFTNYIGRRIPGIGLISVVVLVFIVAIIVSTRPGRWLTYTFERLILHIPLLRSLHNAIKQIFESFTTQAEGTSFLYVVFIEFPKEGMKTVGLVTNRFTSDSGEELLHVFIPTAPNPTNGFLEIVKATDVTPTDMSINDALKMVMSAGKVAAPQSRQSFDHNLQ
jgi:uncharacterized membrane protein